MVLQKEGVLQLLSLRMLYALLYGITSRVLSLQTPKSSMLTTIFNGALLNTLQGTKNQTRGGSLVR